MTSFFLHLPWQICVDFAAKGTLLLGVCWLVSRILWKNASAAQKHAVLLLGVLGLPFLAVFTWNPIPQTIFPTQYQWNLPLAMETEARKEASTVNAAIAIPVDPATSSNTVAAQDGFDAVSVLFGGWIVGIGFIWGRFVVGLATLSLSSKRLITEGALVNQLAIATREMGLNKPPRLYLTARRDSPVTWGWIRQYVMLPQEALAWPDSRQRHVFLHELAHIKRRDCLSAWLSILILGTLWWHPLVWIVKTHLKSYRESACDDLVLKLTKAARAYAHDLVTVTAACQRRFATALGVAISRTSTLKLRLEAIMDDKRLRTPVRLGHWLAMFALWGVLVVSLSGLLSCQTTTPVESLATMSGTPPAEATPTIGKATYGKAPRGASRRLRFTIGTINLPANTVLGNQALLPPKIDEDDRPRGLDALLPYQKGSFFIVDSPTETHVYSKNRLEGLLDRKWDTIPGDVIELGRPMVGQTVRFEATREFVYHAGFDPPGLVEGGQSEHWPVGMQATLTGNLRKSGRLVDINAKIVISTFEGFVDVAPNADQRDARPLIERVILTKRFTVRPEDFIIFGWKEHDQTVQERTPILGDLPLIGELFSKTYEQTLSELVYLRVELVDDHVSK